MRRFLTHRNKYRETARKTSSFPFGCLLFAKSFSTVRRNPLLSLGVFKVSASAFSSDCSSFPQSLLCGSPILRRRKRFHKIYLPFSQSVSVPIVYRHADDRNFRFCHFCYFTMFLISSFTKAASFSASSGVFPFRRQ